MKTGEPFDAKKNLQALVWFEKPCFCTVSSGYVSVPSMKIFLFLHCVSAVPFIGLTIRAGDFYRKGTDKIGCINSSVNKIFNIYIARSKRNGQTGRRCWCTGGNRRAARENILCKRNGYFSGISSMCQKPQIDVICEEERRNAPVICNCSGALHFVRWFF
jgi:hypothetical protein